MFNTTHEQVDQPTQHDGRKYIGSGEDALCDSYDEEPSFEFTSEDS